MAQIHKQFSSEQVKVLLQAYEAGHLSRDEIERTLGIRKTRFFALVEQYRTQDSFSIQCQDRRGMSRNHRFKMGSSPLYVNCGKTSGWM